MWHERVLGSKVDGLELYHVSKAYEIRNVSLAVIDVHLMFRSCIDTLFVIESKQGSFGILLCISIFVPSLSHKPPPIAHVL